MCCRSRVMCRRRWRGRVNVRYGAPDPPGGVARCAAPVSITHGSLRFQTLIGSFGDAHAYIYTARRARCTIIAMGLEIHSARLRRGDESTTTTTAMTIGSRAGGERPSYQQKLSFRKRGRGSVKPFVYIIQDDSPNA